MENLILDLPTMYADHHTLQVRQVLLALEGVEEVYASSAWKQVMISFDPKKIKPTAIEKALAEAGYSSGRGETPALVEASKIKRDPQWQVLGARSTKTNRSDIEMSGEFRRY